MIPIFKVLGLELEIIELNYNMPRVDVIDKVKQICEKCG